MQAKDDRGKCRAQVLKLHLELDLKCISEEEVQILRKYGSMKKSISRDRGRSGRKRKHAGMGRYDGMDRKKIRFKADAVRKIF